MSTKRITTLMLIFIILTALVLAGVVAAHASGLSPDTFTPCGPASDPRPC